MKNIEIKSRNGSYRVDFLPTLKDCIAHAQGESSWFLIDDQVFKLYEKDFAAIEQNRIVRWVANEDNKTFANIEPLFNQLLDAGFKKNSRLVVVGGGVLQDVGGFTASVIYRGVPWHLVPTTLLAQADSCIGAKTSINLTRAKNLLGTFSAPQSVWLTTEVLKTLSDADVRSGLCEAVKLAMVEGPAHVEWMQAHLQRAISGQGLDEFLYRTLIIKKRFIEEDEFDRGVRNLLNFGHTFGHAFESKTNYAIPHGIAVGLGIQAAAFFSVKLKLAPTDYFAQMTELFNPLTAAHMPLIRKISAPQFVGVMKSDKKNTSSDISFILAEGHGRLSKKPVAPELAEKILAEFLALGV